MRINLAPLQTLLTDLEAAITDVSAPLMDGVTQAAVRAWQAAMTRLLATGHVAAMQAGQASAGIGIDLTDAGRAVVQESIATQLRFLDRFAVQLVSDETYQAGLLTRAQSYAQSIAVPYWRGATKFLPLPAMPREGTLCLGNCRCAWEIVDVAGGYDCYWRRAANDSCSTCLARESAWNPLRIRDGRIV